MIAKWVRKETAQNCPVHITVMSKAVEHLVRLGFFSKDAVIRDTSMTAMAEAIRWDYIREFIQDDQDVELIPVAEAFFRRHPKQDELLNPEKYLAQGYSKKTHGFAAVSKQNDHLVVKRIEQRQAITNGVAESFQKFIDKVEAKRRAEGIQSLPSPDTDQLEGPEEEA